MIQTLTHQFWLHQNFKLVSERLHRLHTTWNTLWISAQWEMEIITTQTLTAVLWQAFLLIVSQHLQLHLLIQEPQIKLKKKQFFSFHRNKDHNLSSSSSSYEWTLLNSINSLVSLCEHRVDLCRSFSMQSFSELIKTRQLHLDKKKSRMRTRCNFWPASEPMSYSLICGQNIPSTFINITYKLFHLFLRKSTQS